LRYYWRSGLEGLESVSELYDEIVATLNNTGELDNTYIFLVSDHGIHLGEHRQRYGKNLPYYEDISIPFNVRGPGIPRDVELPHLVGLQYLAPTIMDLAGLSIPSHMDGSSLKPLFSSTPPSTSDWRKRMLIEGYEGGSADKQESSSTDTPEWSGVVTYDQRKYAEYVTGEKEFYDLATYPYELTNTASSNSEAISGLHDYVTNLKSCTGSTCRSAEDNHTRNPEFPLVPWTT
jgi:N-acetylglucosamine-6-sulfatase